MIAHSKPTVTKKDLIRVLECMVDDHLAEGITTRQFENNLQKYLKTRHVILVDHVSSAFYLIFKHIGLTRGDDVILSALAPRCLVEVILLYGGRPVLVDTIEDHVITSTAKIKDALTSKTKAIILSHHLGIATPFEDLQDLQKQSKDSGTFFPVLIEEATHAFGTRLSGLFLGTLGDYGVYSFGVQDMITMGEGSAIITKKREDFISMRHMRHVPKEDSHWKKGSNDQATPPLEAKLNHSITDIQAALGLSELSLVNKFLERRQQIAHYYKECACRSGQVFLAGGDDEDPNYQHFGLVIHSSMDATLEVFKQGKACVKRPFLRNLLEAYPSMSEACPHTRQIAAKVLCVPIYPSLTQKEVEKVGNLIMSLR